MQQSESDRVEPPPLPEPPPIPSRNSTRAVTTDASASENSGIATLRRRAPTQFRNIGAGVGATLAFPIAFAGLWAWKHYMDNQPKDPIILCVLVTSIFTGIGGFIGSLIDRICVRRDRSRPPENDT